MNIGLLIKEYLNNTGRMQKYVSEKAGINPQHLTQSLNGKRKLSVEEYVAICKALDVGPETFLSDCK